RDRTQPLRQRGSDLLRVTRGPNAGAVDASAAAVEEHAIYHHVDVLFPIVDNIVAKQDLRESWTMRLHFRIAAITLDRRSAAEDHATFGEANHFRADIAESWIN